MRIHERWESMEALVAHLSIPHMADFQNTFSQVKPKSMDVKMYKIEKELEFENLSRDIPAPPAT